MVSIIHVRLETEGRITPCFSAQFRRLSGLSGRHVMFDSLWFDALCLVYQRSNRRTR